MRKSLTKPEIVKSKAEIGRIFRQGKAYNCPGLKIIVLPNGLDFSRIIVIPVKHYGNSVQRNHTRRQYKEIFRNLKPEIQTGFDFAFVVYRENGQLSYADKNSAVISLFSKAGVLLPA